MHPYNFGTSGNILTKLFQATCREGDLGGVDQLRVRYLTCVKFSEDPPPKMWEGQKNVQISERFLTTFDFDREYLRNGWAYQKPEK